MGLRGFFALAGLVVSLLGVERAGAAPPFVTYHHATAQEHQTQFNRLVREGYRLRFIGAHGEIRNGRYSATWVKSGGPQWVGFHNRRVADYQGLFDRWTRQGFHPVLLTVSGTGNNAVIAGTFEKQRGAVPLTRVGLRTGRWDDTGTIEYWLDWAYKNNKIPSALVAWGSARDRRFAVILKDNSQKLAWGFGLTESAGDYQKRFVAQTQQWARPLFVMVTNDHRYTSVFVDSQVQGGWVARHNQSWNQYQQEFNRLAPQGFYPVSIEGGGAGNSARFASVFVKSETPVGFRWTARGTRIEGYAAVDRRFEKFMRENRVRSASVAIAKDGKLLYSRGYTLAEPGYPATEPTSMYRIASLSKPITSTAIHLAEQRRLLSRGETFQSILNLRTPAGGAPTDGRMGAITLDHLLRHGGGWDRTKVGDLPDVYRVKDKFGGNFPIFKSWWARTKMEDVLQFTPGTAFGYSNLGYMLLGMALERKTSFSYSKWVRDYVLEPLQISRARVGKSLKKDRLPGEVRYHDSRLRVWRNVVDRTGTWVPAVYGGEDILKFDAFGGWVFSAVEYARFLSAFDLAAHPYLDRGTVDTMWRIDSTEPNARMGYLRGWGFGYPKAGVTAYGHGGALLSVSTEMATRSDGISIVVFLNKNDTYGMLNWLHNWVNTQSSWSNVDFFPSYGMPSFP